MSRVSLITVLLLAACGTKPPPPSHLRSDVGLLDVRLALRKGSSEDILADDLHKDVMLDDTVWIYPVVKLACGDKRDDTIYLANTQKIGAVGRDGDTTRTGWRLANRLQIWNSIKQDMRIEWFEVRPLRPYYAREAPIHYERVPLASREWCRELTGPTGVRRFVVQVSYGNQRVVSGDISNEETVARIPRVSFRPDSTSLGWTRILLGDVPFRDGSSYRQTAAFISCDDRTLVMYGPRKTGCQLDACDPPRAFDSAGRVMFEGYVKFGRLYDETGRRAALTLGQDVKRGDVIHFTTLGRYGIIADDQPGSSWNYGGLPCRLPVIEAAGGYPRIRYLYSALWSSRTLFGKSHLRIIRYEPVALPPPSTPRNRPSRPAVRTSPAVHRGKRRQAGRVIHKPMNDGKSKG